MWLLLVMEIWFPTSFQEYIYTETLNHNLGEGVCTRLIVTLVENYHFVTLSHELWKWVPITWVKNLSTRTGHNFFLKDLHKFCCTNEPIVTAGYKSGVASCRLVVTAGLQVWCSLM